MTDTALSAVALYYFEREDAAACTSAVEPYGARRGNKNPRNAVWEDRTGREVRTNHPRTASSGVRIAAHRRPNIRGGNGGRSSRRISRRIGCELKVVQAVLNGEIAKSHAGTNSYLPEYRAATAPIQRDWRGCSYSR